ncbi:MAG: ATP-binding protein [Brumimicrobium sp.]|nr:ATP-binding protein [Brumimicrobium sp.]
MIKIAITGPESTGKTILASDLANHFNAPWIPEYSREYLEKRNGNYNFEDIEIIAREQEKTWNNVKNERLVFYDTEFTVLKIWSEIKYGKVSPYIIDSLANQQFDHYFICDPVGVKWVDDPLREHPERREEFFELYLRVMESNRRSFTVLSGSWDSRLKKAISRVEEMI